MKKIKKILALAMAVAMVMSFAAINAFAAEPKAATTLTDGTYTVTANLYVPRDKNLINPNWDAYLTNPNVPPMTPVSQNATLVVENGEYTLVLDIVNEYFKLIEIGTTEDGATASVTGTADALEGPFPTRISQLTFQLDSSVSQYVFTGNTERADVVLGPLTVHQTVNFDLTLSVDYSSAV